LCRAKAEVSSLWRLGRRISASRRGDVPPWRAVRIGRVGRGARRMRPARGREGFC
jgi:hypothetical protein